MSVPKKRKESDNSSTLINETECTSKINKAACVEPNSSFKTNTGFLSDYHIYLHPASLSKSRKTLFEKQIISNGGKLISQLSSLKYVKNPVILIDDDLIDKQRLNQIIKKMENEHSQNKGKNW